MKAKLLFALFGLMSIGLLFGGCEEEDDVPDDEKGSLYVKFMNNETSVRSITTIELRPRGAAGVMPEDADEPGQWGDDILAAGESIAPGQHKFFTLNIPNGEWSEYRLGVDDGAGGEILLHEQTGYASGDYPITHWGGDDRTVYVTLSYDESNDRVYVSGWGDNVGIQK